jgi:stage V sporulation protein B
MVIAFPCTIGIAVLSGPILKLLHLYGSTGTTAATMLTTGAIAILFYSLSTLSNGLLQGINRMREPVKNAAIALGLHLIVLLVMMFGLHLGIYAVVYSNAGLFLNSGSFSGYLAITDGDRILCHNRDILT